MVRILDGGGAFSTFEEDQPGYTGGYENSTKTVQQVMQSVKRTFGDEAGVQLEDEDIIRWINDAQEAIGSLNQVIKAKATVKSIAGEASYRFPDERIEKIDSLHYDGQRIMNVPFAQAETSLISQHSSEKDGKPTLWYEWGGRFTLFPTPKDEGVIDLYFTMKPARVESPSDLLSLPDRYYSYVLSTVLQYAYEMDENYEASKMKYEQAQAGLASMYEDERQAQHMSYETITRID